MPPPEVALSVSAPAFRRFVIVTVADSRFVSSGSAATRAGSTATAAPSSVKVGAPPPAVRVGASLTATTVRDLTTVLLARVPSLATNEIERAVVFGLLEEFVYRTVRRTVW